jgi:hypothetical protein
MPIDPGYGERLARRVSELFADAELGLLHKIARALSIGLDTPDWALDRLQLLDRLRIELTRDLDSLTVAAAQELDAVIADALVTGGRLAAADLAAAGISVRVPPTTARAVTTIAADTTRTILAIPPRILRSADDAYRRIVADASAQVLLGARTRRDAAQQAMDRLADRGLTGITDRSGRRWQAASYVEMAVRTAAGQAAVQGHVDTLAASGLDLVVVSDAPRECHLCRPWEGRVLSISGSSSGVVEVPSRVAVGQMVSVRVAGSVQEARAAGLQHPSCRHSLSAYLPGAARVPTPRADPVGYAAQQRQREIERHIRRWKTREAAALDDAAATAARLKVQQWRGAMRDHLAEYEELKRQPTRERIGVAR